MALVIGNSAYPDQPLRNPLNDAKSMAAVLRKLGFTVIERTNAGKKAMDDAILEFGEKLRGGGIGLFYYAGHGIQSGGRNYLVPVDLAVTSEASVRVYGIDAGLVLDLMAESRNRANIVILDACRNNPFVMAARGAQKGLAAIDAARGTLVAYSTAPGRVAADGDGPNSPYTTGLLKALDEPGLKAEEVFKRTRQHVAEATKGAQTPWESSSLTGDLILNLTITVKAPAAATREAADLAFWNAISASNDAQDFQDYLTQFPAGTFSGLAQRRLADTERRQRLAEAERQRNEAEEAKRRAAAEAERQRQAMEARKAQLAAQEAERKLREDIERRRAAEEAATQKQAAEAEKQRLAALEAERQRQEEAARRAQQATLPPQAQLPAPAAGFNGIWTGGDSTWQLSLVIDDGKIVGEAKCKNVPIGKAARITGTISAAGTVAASLYGEAWTMRQLTGNLPSLKLTSQGSCGGGTLTFIRTGEPQSAQGTAVASASPTPTQQAALPPQAATSPATSPAADPRQRAYDRIMGVLLNQTAQSGTDAGKRNDYRSAPKPKAIAGCLDWSGGSADSVTVGAWASSWIPSGSTGIPPRQDALQKCERGNKTPKQCSCAVVDENDTNVLELPRSIAVASAAPAATQQAALPPPPAPQTPQQPRTVLTREEATKQAYEKLMSQVAKAKYSEFARENAGKSVGYLDWKEEKTLAACIYWNASSIDSLRYEGAHPNRGNQIGRMKADALNWCTSRWEAKGCKCQIVDENGKNVLQVPDDFYQRLTAK